MHTCHWLRNSIFVAIIFSCCALAKMAVPVFGWDDAKRLEVLCAPEPGKTAGFLRKVHSQGFRANMDFMPPSTKPAYQWHGMAVWFCRCCRKPAFTDNLESCAFCQKYCCANCMWRNTRICPQCERMYRHHFANTIAWMVCRPMNWTDEDIAEAPTVH